MTEMSNGCGGELTPCGEPAFVKGCLLLIWGGEEGSTDDFSTNLSNIVILSS